MGRSDSARYYGDSRNIISGRITEVDMVGEFKQTPTYKIIAEKLSKEMGKTNGYLPYDVLMDLIRRFATEDPTNPHAEFARELRLGVIDILGYEEEPEMDRVKFFTAVHTAMDFFHGVDAWIELELPDGRKAIVTLDVTKNPDKIEAVQTGEMISKADLVISEAPDSLHEGKEFDRFIVKESKMVAQKLQERVREMRRSI